MYKISVRAIISSIIMTMLACSCRQHIQDSRFEAINDNIEKDAQAALDSLIDINPESLDKESRYYRDFLIIKASDKAYITHTSDSTILDVIEHAKTHNTDYYAESLYYGGRVYSDLGDFPSALRYFQEAAEKLPPKKENLQLRANILSQTGRLFNRLRIYDKASEQLEKVIQIDREINDTTNIFLDIEFLITNHIRNCNFSQARDLIYKTLEDPDIPVLYRRNFTILLGYILYKIGDTQEATNIIRNIAHPLNDKDRSELIAFKAQIYNKAGVYDTAYILAKQLINHPSFSNRRIGYGLLVSTGLRHMSPVDSLFHYMTLYADDLEKYYDENVNQATLLQNAHYNYDVHKRGKEQLLKDNSNLILSLIIISVFVLLILIAFLLIKNRNQRKIILLQEALENIRMLKPESLSSERQETEEPNNSYSPDKTEESIHEKTIPTVNELRTKLRDKLKEQAASAGTDSTVSAQIIQSDIYTQIQEWLRLEKVIPDNKKFWEKVQALITDNAPNFISNLNLLTGGRQLSATEFRTVLLIRLGFQPQQIAILLGRVKATIVSCRNSISLKIFDQKIGTKEIDAIIRVL